mmetsp:Transcript_36857/g.84972  ORF Transcript_36857/g.84972 Transcript_36857/m.84972 type:complete len:1321 (-) Transcript_36857:225-4187(-)
MVPNPPPDVKPAQPKEQIIPEDEGKRRPWSFMISMEGDVELPIPTLRPIGVNLAHQAVTMPQAEVKEASQLLNVDALIGPDLQPGVSRSQFESGGSLGASVNLAGGLDSSTPSRPISCFDSPLTTTTAANMHSLQAPTTPSAGAALHALRNTIQNRTASLTSGPLSHGDVDEVQLPKFLSRTAYEKQVSMLSSSEWRESPMLKTLIHASNSPAQRVIQPIDKAELNRVCDVHMTKQGVIGGSQILLFTTFLAFLYRAVIVVLRIMKDADEPQCNHWPLRMQQLSNILLLCGGEAVAALTCMCAFVFCMRRPYVLLYYIALGMFLLYIVAMSLPPLAYSCDDIVIMMQCNGDEVSEVDCGLQGTTHMMLAMIVVFLAPHIIPHRLMLVRFLGIYLVLYCMASLVYVSGGARDYFDGKDVCLGFVLLFILSGIALYVKNAITKKVRDGFVAQHTKVESSKTMLTILEYMLPQHLVLPMLRSPAKVFAENVDVASVLFIQVVHFNQLALGDPKELLRFLNALFTFIDGACEQHSVTKVETVGEEYVACVGVVPADQASTLTFGHSRALSRLVRLSSLLLKLQQDEEVVLRMGLHSGPVVAGVIGQKLPRFRLFGDTMNTAARMMQTGVDGELQFGQSTLAVLKSCPIEVRAVPRDELVEMKGKGKVACYLLAWRSGQGTDVRRGFQELRTHSSQSRLPNTQEGPTGATDEFSHDHSQSTSRRTLSLRKSASMSSRHTRGTVERWGRAILNSPAMGGVAAVHAAFEDISESSAFVKEMTPNTKYQMAVQMVKEQARNSSIVTSEEDHDQCGKVSTRIDHTGSVASLSRKVSHKVSTSLSESESLGFWDYYYVNKLSKIAGHRVNLYLTLIVGSTLAEAALAILLGLGEGQDVHPLLLFSLARIGMVTSLLLLKCVSDSRFISMTNNINRRRVKLVYTRLIFFLVMIILALASYASLMMDSEPLTSDLNEIAAKHVLKERPLRIRIWSLLFVVEYLTMLVEIRLPSVYVLLFAVLCTAITSSVAYTPFFSKLIMHKDITFIVAMSLIGLRLSRVRAQSCLLDYKAGRDVESTSAQIEVILRSFLPPRVLAELKFSQDGSSLPTHTFKNATVVQCDLVGFTGLASTWQPEQVVRFISELFGRYDDLTDEYQIWKIETVGDAYIAGQAEPPLTDINVATEVVRFALSALQTTEEFILEKQGEYTGVGNVSCRCGVHSGECIGGIVGERMQRYHLFGDLLTQLDLLESTAGVGRVHVSKSCAATIEEIWAKLDEEEDETISRPFCLKKRVEDQLITSKGKIISYDQVGGCPTYIVEVEDDDELRASEA